MEKCSTQTSISTTPPPPASSLFLHYLPPPPLPALPPSPPLCPDHCPAHPSARGQWLTFKEKQEKRGARCHRIACLLTESLKAAPHKSKQSIMAIVSPRATCPTKIPLLCSLFSGTLWQREWAKSEVEVFLRGRGWVGGRLLADLALFRGFLTVFFLPRHPTISLFCAPTTPTHPPHQKKDSLSLDQHNLSLCTL